MGNQAFSPAFFYYVGNDTNFQTFVWFKNPLFMGLFLIYLESIKYVICDCILKRKKLKIKKARL